MKKTSSTKVSLTDSLKFRINAFIVCIVVVVMGGYASIDYLYRKAQMEKELQFSADITTQRLSKHLREPLWALDDEIIDEALASEMLDKQIFAIQILDRDSKEIYKDYLRDKDWNLTSSLSSIDGDFIVKQANIVRGNDKIGEVRVYVTDRFLKADFNRSMIILAATVGLLVVTIIISVSTVFQRMVINPIANMANLTDRISLGELDIKIPSVANNEIGTLAGSIERMQASLRISIRRLGKNN